LAGFIFVAFIVVTYARRVVGWRAKGGARHFALDARDRALILVIFQSGRIRAKR
jgi:hypothetical protein